MRKKASLNKQCTSREKFIVVEEVE
jgi:hypothetical protein